MKMIETNLADCWKKCIDSKVSMPITTLRIYNSGGDLASCLISNEASAIQCQQAPCEHMDVGVQSNSTVDNRPEMHGLTKDPIEDNTKMDTDEQESTLLDVRETIETFTTGTTDQIVSSTPPSRNTQQYERINYSRRTRPYRNSENLILKYAVLDFWNPFTM